MENVRSAPSVPRLAATVMVLRDGPGGLEVYLTRRSAKSRFVPDAYVFPGGSVDPGDGEPAVVGRLVGTPDPNPALAVAALREVFEESGMLAACDGGGGPFAPGPERIAAMRSRLAAPTPLATVLADAGAYLDVRSLVRYSHWITPESEPIRFDTHFYVLPAPAGQVARADARETHDGRWMAPAAALDAARAGTLAMIFPTRMHLERLSTLETVANALSTARSRRTIVTVVPEPAADGSFALPSEAAQW